MHVLSGRLPGFGMLTSSSAFAYLDLGMASDGKRPSSP